MSLAFYYYLISLYYLCIVVHYEYFLKIQHLKFGDALVDYSPNLKYLTHWNIVVQATYFLGTAANYLTKSEEVVAVRRFLSLILTSLVFPLSVFISVVFWSLYAWDRDLIFPESFELFLPDWLNHIVHTNIALLAVMECLVKPHIYPSKKVGLGILYFVLSLYTVWLHVIHFRTQKWVYPFLEELNLLFRIFLFIFTLIFASCVYILGEKWNGMVWSKYHLKRKTE